MYDEIISLLNKISYNVNDLEEKEKDKYKNDILKLKQQYSRIKNVVIVKLDAIGDWILFYDSYKKVRSLFPNAKISLIIYEDVKEALRNYEDIAEYLTVERKSFIHNTNYRESLLAFLRKTNYDILINPLYSREFNSDLICQFTNAKIKIGVKGDNSNILKEISAFTDSWYDFLLPVDKSKVMFELRRNIEIVHLLGYKTEEYKLPEIPIKEKDTIAVEEVLKENDIGDYAILFPGTRGAENSIKFWDIDKYAMVVDYLHSKKLEVIILGGEEEEKMCFTIARKAKKNPVVFVNHSNIWQSAAIIKKAKLYVGSDTSMAHIAAALKIPTVVILGGGHFGRFFPYPGNEHVVPVFIKMDCYYCNWKCIKDTVECIKKIEANDVINACERFFPEKLNNKAFNSHKASPGFVKNVGSLPKIDLLLPDGNHSWHLKEGVLNTLKSSNLLNEVFVLNQYNCSDYFDYILKGTNSDMIFAPGGDHHLYFLHNTREKRLLWDEIKQPKVCYSYESTSDSIYPQYKERAETSYSTFSHFLYSDEVDASIFEKKGLKSLYFPQFADEKMFKNKIPYLKRKQRIMFCGKLWQEYQQRKKIINALNDAGFCDTYNSLKTLDLIWLYNQYGITINPPGVLGGFNVRTFEALATGSVLLQFEPESRPLNNRLFENNKHLIYFKNDDNENLIRLANEIVKNYGDYAKVAKEGHNEFLARHTTEIRLNNMIEWVLNNNGGAVTETDVLTSKNENKIKISEKPNNILLSAIVSTYNSEYFIKDCLHDLVSQSLFIKGQMEIIVVNSASQENEEHIIREYQAKYSNIKYIYTSKREGIYKAWNRAIKDSIGKYITNSNTDDRHSTTALEKMVGFLEQHSEYDLVYANDLQTTVPNDLFDSNIKKTSLNWSEYDKDLLLFGCFIGPHPVWKRSLHENYGYFDETLQVVGDYEFWLRISAGANFHHFNETLGLYYYSDKSAEHRDPDLTITEHTDVQNKYLIAYLNTELDIRRVEMKLSHLKKFISNVKYLENVDQIIKKRYKGIQIQQQIQEFSNNDSFLEDPLFLAKIDNFIEIIENNDLIIDSSLFLGILYSLKAIFYFSNGNAEIAKELFIKSLMNDPQNQTSLQSLKNIFGKRTDLFVHFMLIFAEDLINQQKLGLAKIFLERVLENEFNNLDALNNLAAIEIMNDNIELANSIIDRTLAVDPGNEIALNNLNYIKQLVTESQ